MAGGLFISDKKSVSIRQNILSKCTFVNLSAALFITMAVMRRKRCACDGRLQAPLVVRPVLGINFREFLNDGTNACEIQTRAVETIR